MIVRLLRFYYRITSNQIYRLEPSGHKLPLSSYAAPVQGFTYKTTEKTQLNKLKASIHQSIQPVKFQTFNNILKLQTQENIPLSFCCDPLRSVQ